MATKFDIEKFNGRNFSLWKLKMKAILRKDGCLAAISERPVDFTDDNKWIEMDGNAMANFHLALADEVLSSIEEKKTTKEIWDHLTKLYETTSLHNKIFLKRKLYTLRMPESTSVTEHLNTLNTLFSQLTSLSCKIREQERAELLLQSLPDSYDQLIINLTNSNVTSLIFDDVAAAVLQEENRRKNKEDRQVNLQQPEALTTMTTIRGRSTEHGQSSSRKHGRSKSRSKKNLKCYNCGKKGHLKKDCWSLNKNFNPQSNTANTSDDGDALCCEASTTVEGRKRFADIWLIDSGATYHMTSRREWFHHYEPVSGGSVYSCNDHALEIIGVGTIKLKMYDGTIKVVRDVRHVKGLKKNLLSYGLLDNNASKIETRKGIMKVFRGALVVLKGEKIAANLYMLKGETLLEAEASVASCSLDSAMLWHQKLGHMSEQGMKVLVEQKLLPGLTNVSLTLCEHCITTRVELDSGNKIKCFRIDNGGEYTSEEFDDFCKKEGIKRQFTVVNTPQQNGVAERMNRTLLERTRVMLRDAGLEKSFWAEAVNTACYLVNRAPSTAIELKTPMEMWTGKPVDYSNLHVFGSIVYVMYKAQEISKLYPKSRKCKFLGYTDGVKGYRLWDPTARKVIISRDVIFVEDKLQRKEDDDSAEKSETTQIHVEKEVEQGDYSEAEPAHDEQEPESSETPTTRQSDRVRRRPNWHSDYVIEGNIAYCLLTEDGEPLIYQEAINSSDASLWMMAMQEEIEALHKNNTWDLVPLLQGRKPIGNKWVFKIKRNGDDQVERYRARLVVKGYAQKEGIDFNEIFSPVVLLTTVRVVLAMCATLNLHLEQLDVKTAFLHGNLEEEIYMLQPEGFEEDEKKNLVCRLNKSLYGLKQAPRCWYKRFDSFIMCLGYNRLTDPCAYFKRSGDNDFVILLLYVDDMLVAGPNKDHIEELKAQLAREFEMKDLGSANKILGMQIHRDRSNRKIWLSQKKYLKKILSRFNMQDCKPISTPLSINFKLSSSMSPSNKEERMEMSRVPYASAVGSLMFAMICTRPDIAQAVGVVSRYMANPGKEHWNTVKRILRYIKGISNVALCYEGSNLLINGYVDSDYAGDLDKSKSTTGYVFKVAGGAVSWISKLQSIVATSTIEAEYVAATQASKEAIWLKMLLEELGHNQEYVSLFCDSQSAFHLARNPTFHSRIKHIRVQYHFIREKVEEGTVDMQKIHTKDNIADFMTKAINANKFTWCRSSCGMSETCDLLYPIAVFRNTWHFTHCNISNFISQLCFFKLKSITMVARSMIKEENKSSKPKTKSLKTRAQRIKADMGKIREDQRCIREEQRGIGEKFGDVRRQCHDLRLETQMIVKQSTFNRIRRSIMFSILRARQDGDFDKAAAFSGFLISLLMSKFGYLEYQNIPHIGRQVLRTTSLLDEVGRHARPATYQVAMHAQRPRHLPSWTAWRHGLHATYLGRWACMATWRCSTALSIWLVLIKRDRLEEFLSMDMKAWMVMDLSKPNEFVRVVQNWDILFSDSCPLLERCMYLKEVTYWAIIAEAEKRTVQTVLTSRIMRWSPPPEN
ncbi:Retrovirus-related Pol polyprotein from transposon TNT 1-94 [Hibiscus syriacus]|uniref:Retrovirus-related Pol polyprotein from transposon TNT 1-94 n=1 Tax=Hibiscus syriacus TaxID=106335 RepID=A0A6A2YJE9_HIBSY|nr:Retrovirus-related Pol polyprotein from transposon TNT 1-94 [Hibiscus syriacus]